MMPLKITIEVSNMEYEHIEAIKDSIAASLPLLRELAENSSPEPYTIENLWWTKINVAISVIAAIMGAIGAWYGYKGFVQSRKTAQNVIRMSLDTQLKLCTSLIFDLIRNYVRAVVVIINKTEGKIPTENYISSFTIADFQDVFFPESFNQKPDAFLVLSYVKQRLLHYKKLLSLISNHCAKDELSPTDCKDLLEKPIKIIKSIFVFVNNITPDGCYQIKNELLWKISSIIPMSIKDEKYNEVRDKIIKFRNDRDNNSLMLENILINCNTGNNPFNNENVYNELKRYYTESDISMFQNSNIDKETLRRCLQLVMEYNIVFESQFFTSK